MTNESYGGNPGGPVYNEVHVGPGQVLITEGKNPIASTVTHGVLVLIAARLLRTYVGHLFPDLVAEETWIPLATELTGWAIGAVMIFVGRTYATRPLAWRRLFGARGAITRTVVRLAALSLLPCLAGCPGLNRTWVEADRGYYETIAPDHRSYIEGDANLPERDKARRLRTLDIWGDDVAGREKALGITPPAPAPTPTPTPEPTNPVPEPLPEPDMTR